eukprot:m.472128 g.472128  ORF g.472128 m.472128 type:complete len:793 (+) comp32149_c0_seq1:124-2502(+)
MSRTPAQTAFFVTREFCKKNAVQELRQIHENPLPGIECPQIQEWRVCQPEGTAEDPVVLSSAHVTAYTCRHVEVLKLVGDTTSSFTKHDEFFCVLCEMVMQRSSSIDAVRFLVEHCDAIIDKPPSTFLHSSLDRMIMFGAIDVLRMLTTQCGVKITQDQFVSACFTLRQESDVATARFLVDECGVDPNGKNRYGDTPLYYACDGGATDVARYLLLECKVDTSDTNKVVSAFYASMGRGYLGTIKCLLKDCGFQNLPQFSNEQAHFQLAIQSGQTDWSAIAVSGEDEDKEEDEMTGEARVSVGRGKNHLVLVKWLVECGMDPKLPDETYGETPIMWAAEKGHLDVVKYLVTECGCDVNHLSKAKESALYNSCRGGHLEICRYLVECNADVTVRNVNELVLLHMACFSGHLHVVKYLREVVKNMSIDCRSTKGSTPLYLACMKNRLSIAQFLITECHADPTIGTNNGTCPLHIACKNGQLRVVQYLVKECGISMSVKTNDRWSAVHFAANAGHFEIVKFWVDECLPDDKDRPGELIELARFSSKRGQLNIVQYLLQLLHRDSEVDADFFDSYPSCYRVLEGAVQSGQLAIVKMLLDEFMMHDDLISGFTCRIHLFEALYESAARGPERITPGVINTILYLGIRGVWPLNGPDQSSSLSQLMTAVQEMPPLQLAVASGMLDEVKQICRDSDHDVSSIDCKTILGLVGSPPTWGLPLDKLSRSLAEVRASAMIAVAPWSPKTHSLYHRGVRKAVGLVILVQRRESTTLGSRLPALPYEMWLHILSFFRRDDFEFRT